MALVLTGNSSTLTVDSTSGITFPNTTNQASAGVVLQVISATSSTPFITASATYASTGLAITITPKFTTSKVLLLSSIFFTASASTCQPTVTVYRGASNIALPYGFGDFYTASGGYSEAILSINYLDSPATTNATTYTIYGRNSTAAGSATFFDAQRTSTFTVLEIAG